MTRCVDVMQTALDALTVVQIRECAGGQRTDTTKDVAKVAEFFLRCRAERKGEMDDV